jgi:hypothetical protein
VSTQVCTLRLSFEQDPPGFVDELAARVSALSELVPASIELLDLLGRISAGAVALNLNLLPAVGAGEQRIVLKLSETGLELLLALRALKVPSDLIGETGHSNSLSVESGDATVTESPAGQKLAGDEAKKNSGDMS